MRTILATLLLLGTPLAHALPPTQACLGVGSDAPPCGRRIGWYVDKTNKQDMHLVLHPSGVDVLELDWDGTDLTFTSSAGGLVFGEALTLSTGDLTLTTGGITASSGTVTASTGAFTSVTASSVGFGSIGITNGPSIRATSVSVTATEIRTLAASPKTLVAAAASTAYVFRGLFVKYVGGDNVFDSVGAGEDLAVRYTDGSGQTVSAALDTTTDINFGATDDDESWIPSLATVVNPVTNAALVLDNIGGGELATTDDDSDGDGTLTVILLYDAWSL